MLAARSKPIAASSIHTLRPAARSDMHTSSAASGLRVALASHVYERNTSCAYREVVCAYR